MVYFILRKCGSSHEMDTPQASCFIDDKNGPSSRILGPLSLRGGSKTPKTDNYGADIGQRIRFSSGRQDAHAPLVTCKYGGSYSNQYRFLCRPSESVKMGKMDASCVLDKCNVEIAPLKNLRN